MWQPLRLVCPLDVATTSVRVPIEQLPRKDPRSGGGAAAVTRQHQSKPRLYRGGDVDWTRGFGRRLYVDLGARDFGSSIGGWFQSHYPSGKSFAVHAFEAEHAYDESYQGVTGVHLHHFAGWVRNASLPWGERRAPNGEVMNFALGPLGADKQRTGSHWFMLFMLFCCRRRRRLCCLCCSSHTGVCLM